MSVAVALQFEEGIFEDRPHPVPFGAKVDDSRALLKRSTAISLGLHGLLALLAVAIHYWPSDELVGTPQDIQFLDATIVPLSALDTVLPKGAPDAPVNQPPLEEAAPPPAQPEPLKSKLENKRIVEARSISIPKATTESPRANHSSSKASDTAVASEAAKLGVANGSDITLESARISYQDMVATRLARAKRYPERALKRGMTGEGSIRIEISSDGSVKDVEILRSTEAPVLDDELRAMVDRAAPFPAFPSDLHKSSVALVVPIAFRLQN